MTTKYFGETIQNRGDVYMVIQQGKDHPFTVNVCDTRAAAQEMADRWNLQGFPSWVHSIELSTLGGDLAADL